MLKIKGDVLLVPLTELRNRAKEILKEAERGKVILELHHKPVAVLMSFKTYEFYEMLIEQLEDEFFGKIAEERMAKKHKWISHEKMKKSAGLA